MLFSDHEAKAESLRLGFLAVQRYINGKEVIYAHLDNAIQSQCTQTMLHEWHSFKYGRCHRTQPSA